RGLGQRGRVVDAVADHGRGTAAGLQVGDELGLGGGERIADDLVDADRGGDGLGGGVVVAGQQDRTQAELAQGGDGSRGRGLDGAGEGQSAADDAVPADQDRGAAGALLSGTPGGQGGGDLAEEPGPADDDVVAGDLGP